MFYFFITLGKTRIIEQGNGILVFFNLMISDVRRETEKM